MYHVYAKRTREDQRIIQKIDTHARADSAEKKIISEFVVS